MSHSCHAVGCEEYVPPRMLFCPKHWGMTPKNLQALIWKHYVPGQEERKDPTDEYLEAQELVVRFVESLEAGRPILPVWHVLSLTQPWASLVVPFAVKVWETRSRRSHYRGPLAIHSSKEFPKWCAELVEEEPAFVSGLGGASPSSLPKGRILGVVDMVDCQRTEVVLETISGTREEQFGDYSDGRFAYRLQNPCEVVHVEVAGALGIWRYAGELVDATTGECLAAQWGVAPPVVPVAPSRQLALQL